MKRTKVEQAMDCMAQAIELLDGEAISSEVSLWQYSESEMFMQLDIALGRAIAAADKRGRKK